LPEITFQWRSAGGTGRYYRISLAAIGEPQRRYELYIPCRPPPPDPFAPLSDECHYPVPARVWELIAGELRGAAVTVTLDAADDQPAVVATSEPVTLTFSEGALEAGVHYFSQGRSGVLRALVGAAAQPLILPTNRFGCAGCHAVSRDGQALAFSYERRYLGTARAEEPARLLVTPADPPQPDAATVALSSDGSLVAVSLDGRLSVRETATGRELSALAASAMGGLYFPEWSPDGKEIAATLATQAENAYTVNDGSIAIIPWQGTGFGPLRVLVAGDATRLHFSPAWSPDGAWIVFASAPRPGRSYDNPQASLHLVPLSGDRKVDLVAATTGPGPSFAGPGQGAGWPHFAPTTHAGGNVLYLTFDSKLDYGYLLRNTRDPMGGHAQIWLAAIDLRKLPGDPSSAPLWLPFQDLHVTNVMAAWTERLACGSQSPCPDRSRCESGRCVRIPP
jgi:hypothetical protein